MVSDLLVYSNIPGSWDSLFKKASTSIERGFMKYPMSGRNLTGCFLPLHHKKSFRGKRWWWKWTWRTLFAVSPGSRREISSIGTRVGTSLWDGKELQMKTKQRWKKMGSNPDLTTLGKETSSLQMIEKQAKLSFDKKLLTSSSQSLKKLFLQQNIITIIRLCFSCNDTQEKKTFHFDFEHKKPITSTGNKHPYRI